MRGAIRNGIIYAASLLVLLVFLAPILWVLVISFKLRRDIFTWPPSVIDFTPTWVNYTTVLSGSGKFVTFITNSVIVAVISTAIALAVGTLGAYALSGKRRPKSIAWSYWMLYGVAFGNLFTAAYSAKMGFWSPPRDRTYDLYLSLLLELKKATEKSILEMEMQLFAGAVQLSQRAREPRGQQALCQH